MNGLKNKLPEIFDKLQSLRKGDDQNAGEEISLRKYIPEHFKSGTDGTGEPLTVEHLYAEMGIDENRTTVNKLMDKQDGYIVMAEVIREAARRSMGLAQREMLADARAKAIASMAPITGEYAGGQHFVSPEIFLDPINRGAVQGTFYPDLIVREIPVAQPQVIMPRFDLSDAALADSNEAVTAEEGTITYGSKTVTITKKMKAIKFTDESYKFSPLSLVSTFLEDFGRLYGNTLNGMAVDCIVNGDQADGSEAAAVIGVANTGSLTWADLVVAAVRFGLIGETGSQILGSETSANAFLNLNEVKNRFLGSPLLATRLRTPLQMPEDLYISSHIGSTKTIIQDPSNSMVQLTAQPLLVETERLVMKQITGTVLSTYTGFAKLQRKASVVIDNSIAFSGNGFPAFMTPAA